METELELIYGDGEFNESGFEDFMKHGVPVPTQVVAIMGAQSSGKSTLMNALFSTNFTEMNAETGRSKTTKGIWIAKAPHVEPFTVVLDLEGTDGKERGEDDTTFEKQSALFSLAVADIVLINMWCSDIGREHAANRPLLKTIFEAMMVLFSPQKTSLIFVIRDKTETPSKLLERNLREDVEKIWEAVPKPQGRKNTPLADIFNVEVTVLSHYDFMRDVFEKEVAQLRQQFSHPQRHDDDLPTSKLCLSSAKKIWDKIKEYKRLKLPLFKVMVATVRCDEIVMEKLKLIESNKGWLDLQEKTETKLVSDFGAQTSSILSKYLSEYDDESKHLEQKDVIDAKRQYLTSEALKLVHPAYMNTVGHLRSKASLSFKTQLEEELSKGGIRFAESVETCRNSCVLQFNQQYSDYAAIKQANWDVSTVSQQLSRDLEAHALVVQKEKLLKIEYQLREELSTKLTTQLLNILGDVRNKDIWVSIRSLLERESDAAKSGLRSAVDMFQLNQQEVGLMVADLAQHARKRVETDFEEEARNVVKLMKTRFVNALSLMDYSEPSVKKEAYRECLNILSTMAVIRLDKTYDNDNVKRVLCSGLMDANSGIEISTDPLSSSTWEKVPEEITLITPIKCRDIWNQFKLDMELQLANAIFIKKYEKEKNGLSLPTWAIVGLAILGLAAFTALIWLSGAIVELALIAAAIWLYVEVEDGIYRYSKTQKSIAKDTNDVQGFFERHPVLKKILEETLMGLSNYMTGELLPKALSVII